MSLKTRHFFKRLYCAATISQNLTLQVNEAGPRLLTSRLSVVCGRSRSSEDLLTAEQVSPNVLIREQN